MVLGKSCPLLGLGFTGHAGCDTDPSVARIGPSPSNARSYLVLLSPQFRGPELNGPFLPRLFISSVGFCIISPVIRALTLPSVEVTDVRTDC